jgi:hypothetical protein
MPRCEGGRRRIQGAPPRPLWSGFFFAHLCAFLPRAARQQPTKHRETLPKYGYISHYRVIPSSVCSYVTPAHLKQLAAT